MKNLFLIITLIFIGNQNCYSQTVLDTDGLNNTDNVFLFSLKQYCNTLDSVKTKVVYVRRDDFIGDTWPTKIKGIEIKYLTEYEKVIQEIGGHITLVGICPLEFRKGQFSVSVIPFSATYSKKMVGLGNGGGLTIYFEHDCNKNGLIYKTEKWNGI